MCLCCWSQHNSLSKSDLQSVRTWRSVRYCFRSYLLTRWVLAPLYRSSIRTCELVKAFELEQVQDLSWSHMTTTTLWWWWGRMKRASLNLRWTFLLVYDILLSKIIISSHSLKISWRDKVQQSALMSTSWTRLPWQLPWMWTSLWLFLVVFADTLRVTFRSGRRFSPRQIVRKLFCSFLTTSQSFLDTSGLTLGCCSRVHRWACGLKPPFVFTWTSVN